MDTQKNYKNTIIIGAGPIGIACALACKKNNIDYVVLEKGALTNSIFNYPLNMNFFSTSEKLELNEIPFISKNPKPDRNEALEYYRRVATSNKLNINLFETVATIKKNKETFTVTTDKNTYNSSHVIIATGFYDIPELLNVPGENLPNVAHYYKEAHPYIMQKVAVVGASNSAVDAALEIYRKGGDVTMIIRGKNIGERVKYWVRPDIINRIEEGSIKAFFSSEILNIELHKITIKTPQGNKTIENDAVVALTGYRPNFEFLKASGINISEEKNIPEYNPETMESNVKGLYLAGVICGGNETHKWFIENSRVHAKMIINDLKKSKI
ncbi:pyridine nucleotide-disulfide oxidoreductase [Patiriisocius marinistellae]|uniref:Pyridine nucleotide-disulfide oxidoreductase n=1 Tax=Patiriisocius marinistellae TaxID=2494560 RepID=A0A5J4FWG4_9FLAO|nr:YpdA family putative bacillithiol disulfide reductase [Patiriisocius marinistellae]GEQ87017.1 pyridine nucleotide-disulfide oxidoreductase [Patiriisocius marinistellae]